MRLFCVLGELSACFCQHYKNQRLQTHAFRELRDGLSRSCSKLSYTGKKPSVFEAVLKIFPTVMFGVNEAEAVMSS